jgi:hypothetical protein
MYTQTRTQNCVADRENFQFLLIFKSPLVVFFFLFHEDNKLFVRDHRLRIMFVYSRKKNNNTSKYTVNFLKEYFLCSLHSFYLFYVPSLFHCAISFFLSCATRYCHFLFRNFFLIFFPRLSLASFQHTPAQRNE